MQRCPNGHPWVQKEVGDAELVLLMGVEMQVAPVYCSAVGCGDVYGLISRRDE